MATRPAHALFVLLPPTDDVDVALASVVASVLSSGPAELRARIAACTLRRYAPADDAQHLASLVRAGRDPLATRWLRGVMLAIFAGAALGMLVNGVLAGAFGMFGGLVELAVPLGLVLGAFLGGFTAAMTGTERPRAELHELWPHVQRGAVLVTWSGDDREALAAFAAHAEARSLPCVRTSRDA